MYITRRFTKFEKNWCSRKHSLTSFTSYSSKFFSVNIFIEVISALFSRWEAPAVWIRRGNVGACLSVYFSSFYRTLSITFKKLEHILKCYSTFNVFHHICLNKIDHLRNYITGYDTFLSRVQKCHQLYFCF